MDTMISKDCLKDDIRIALQAGDKLKAMKAIRAITGGGLLESKYVLEAFYEAWGVCPDPEVYPETDYLQQESLDQQPMHEYIVAVQADYETWTNIFNCEQSAMDYAEGRTPHEAVTVGKVIAKSVAKTTYTLQRV